ncbi:hypothetical protein AVT65_gp34 [Gordonia phage Gmala1]|uniref:Uncharacterized protein n=1 Tax=Gordonia phage Gmala1 TaxID=1622190 RepID=A0A0E3X9T0_9CAUD|nr:hypothetical protein AVT65_gp34 [Gordonia phage Gmala1]AKC02872.1 hypothetical protein Gmala1_34 [Gordonia phage Gmala1]
MNVSPEHEAEIWKRKQEQESAENNTIRVWSFDLAKQQMAADLDGKPITLTVDLDELEKFSVTGKITLTVPDVILRQMVEIHGIVVRFSFLRGRDEYGVATKELVEYLKNNGIRQDTQ